MNRFFQKKASVLLLSFFSVLPLCATAGGIALGGTRIIYAQDSRQFAVSVRNTDDKATFLVQSWVEQGDGQKTKDFVVTPPLFTSGPGDENLLRLVYSGKPLPRDRESLYYFNTKAIPSVNKEALEGKNALILAAITRIKLFVRPANLKPLPEAAPAALRFKRSGQSLNIENPTPYYLTLTDLKSGGVALKDTMVAPMSLVSVALPSGAGGDISFSTVNDYGGVTPPQKGVLL
ncbi:fimbria/pilus periplasmic chaperone [Yersinia kristensenii]|uniref:fimbria/pilus periplasmic chaperone n=1 Tax=Yersinia kristensenii TaxID=28152 RepID=UPI000B762E0D|nr:fimbria/pilus periplasmic chaperone [Yersinia kristensenii]MBW5816672.1 fimbria/pilus periplasmic chaperone [Yersinia kristensenii]MBW5841549.1 fimbria/pilus periplasmic chaperone [Yersinia kristensenii]MDA5489317.1 fimbria/pilus periplasmic chaperone [Yersinia kristensenii]OWF84831.1 fimbrial chaperone protein [Yersinia kristensenii]